MGLLVQEILKKLEKLEVHAENIEHLLQPKTWELKANISDELNPEQLAEQVALMLRKHPICHQ